MKLMLVKFLGKLSLEVKTTTFFMCLRLNVSKNNENFIDFLFSDIGSQILRENMLSINKETEKIFCENYYANESIYDFSLRQQDKTKKVIHAILTCKNSFSDYLIYFLEDI